MEPFPPDLDKTLCGMPEDLRFEDGSPVYNEEGVDLSLVRDFLAKTPAERMQDAQAAAQFVLSVRARNPHV
jgi:hypothetical protein